MNQYKLHKKPLQMVCYILNWVQVLFRVNSTCHTSKAGYRHTDEYIKGTGTFGLEIGMSCKNRDRWQP